MKFYSVSNPDYRSTAALSLVNLRMVSIVEDPASRRASRFSVRLEYGDEIVRCFNYLTEDRAHMIYKDILDILNKEG